MAGTEAKDIVVLPSQLKGVIKEVVLQFPPDGELVAGVTLWKRDGGSKVHIAPAGDPCSDVRFDLNGQVLMEDQVKRGPGVENRIKPPLNRGEH